MRRPLSALGLAIMAILAGLLVTTSMASSAYAVEPDEILSDPALEARARNLSAELRCLVCQNQSIDDSNAPLARDLRLLVRERLKAGDNDDQIIEFVVARYGEFVLLRPRLSASTLVLWLSPILLLALGVWLARGVMMRTKMTAGAPAIELSDDEKARLKDILGQQKQDHDQA